MDYFDKYNEWLNNGLFLQMKEELQGIVDDKKEIEDRFNKDLKFESSCIVSLLGAGTNRVNIFTIRKFVFGFANYIKRKFSLEELQRGIVIAYDSRFNSIEFCLEIVKVLSANNIKSYIYEDLRSAPELSFAITYLNCLAGVVITASYLPSNYNGYRVYSSYGCEVCKDDVSKISKEMDLIIYLVCLL